MTDTSNDNIGYSIHVDGDLVIRHPEVGKFSDGNHSFDELYEHRCFLFVGLMLSHRTLSWWSRLHHDGTSFGEEWIVAGMNLPTGPITYHMLDRFIPFIKDEIPELDYAPIWDGHNSNDVIQRLGKWMSEYCLDTDQR